MNTPTYKKYIDFAAENQLEYIIIDEGWSGKESLMEDISPEINLEELVAYGNQKGIGIILWASWRNLTGGGDISCRGTSYQPLRTNGNQRFQN